MRKKFLSAFVSCLVAGHSVALTVVDDDANRLDIGGYLSLAAQIKDSKTTAKNDSARVNFKLGHKLSEQMEGYALFEWGYKAKNEYSHENDVTKSSDLFTNRQGYVGVKHSQWGALAFGKQCSVYGDVAGWTDQYAIDGSQAMGMYNGFTADGGFSGTGRADDAFTYRIKFGGFKVGAQYQLRGTNYPDDPRGDKFRGDVKRNHGYQIAASYAFDSGISVGMAFNETSLETFPYATGTNNMAVNADAQNIKARAATLGIKYITDELYLGATFGQFKNHTSVHLGLSTARSGADNMGLDKDSEGIELYGRYKLSKLLDGRMSLEAGWNYVRVEEDNTRDTTVVNFDSSDAKLDKTMVGALYEIGRLEFAAEYIFNNSKVFDSMTNNVKEYKNGSDYILFKACYYL